MCRKTRTAHGVCLLQNDQLILTRRLSGMAKPNHADFRRSWAVRGIVKHVPGVEPPQYLAQLSPDLYQQECERVAARFDEAVRLAEQVFMEELQNLVTHLTERLTGQTDGKPKVFRDSCLGDLTAFFQRSQQLNVRSSDQLDELVELPDSDAAEVADQR